MHLHPSIARLRFGLSRFAVAGVLPLLAALALGILCPAATLRAADLPTVSVMASNPDTGVGEAPGVFTVSIAEALKANLTVDYTVKGTAKSGTDYVMLSGSKKIKAGKTSANIPVVSKENSSSFSSSKTIKLVLKPRPDYKIGSPKRATVTIVIVLP